MFQDIIPSAELLTSILVPSTLTDNFNTAQTSSTSTSLTFGAQESLYDLLEYVDLLQLGSPRVQSTDQVDPFISRYSIPEGSIEGKLEIQNIRVLRWEGLIPAHRMLDLLYGLMYVGYRLSSCPIFFLFLFKV